jgi:flagellar hook-basal body complex protein FliE
LEASDLSSLIRKITQTVGAFLVVGLLSTTVANADQAITVAAADNPATTVSTASTPATATAPDANTVADAQCSGPLCDVPANSWAYDAVNQLAKDGIIKGYPDGLYKGARPMTRYEAAVLAYRAVDMIEAQLTANKAVAQADIDAAKKLMAAFGAELKAVENHVDQLQQEADATKAQAAATAGTVAGLADTARRAQVHMLMYFRSFAYNQNITGNCGPGAYAGGQGAQDSYCAANGSGAQLAAGSRTAGWGPTYGNDPPSNSNAMGYRAQGLGAQYDTFSIGGNPSQYTSYLFQLSNSIRYDNTSGQSIASPAYCNPQIYAGPGGICTFGPVNVGGVSSYGNADPFTSVYMGQAWFQFNTPGGFYARVGHVQENEGPQNPTPAWILTDYFYGGFFGYRQGRANAYVAYGWNDGTGNNIQEYGVNSPQQTLAAEADYNFKLGPGALDVGFTYANYSGNGSTLWDPAAVLCTGPAGASRVFANTAATPFVSCGAGFTPITYTNGAPITGSYINGLTGANGAAVNNAISQIGMFGVLNYGPLRVYLAGTDKTGNDPYTGTGWKGNLTGFVQADYGPYLGRPGAKGHFTYEVVGFAAQFNGVTPNLGTFGGPVTWNNFSTNWSGYYWANVGVKYWVSDQAYAGVFYAHAGLLPYQIMPAGGVTCPGCVVTGDSRNAVYGEVNLAF